jgi:hypothetical protein
MEDLRIANAKCPICRHDYDDIDSSLGVCDAHLGWFVMVCKSCERVRFGDNTIVCVRCSPTGMSRPGFGAQGSPNRRVLLAHYGLEKFEG